MAVPATNHFLLSTTALLILASAAAGAGFIAAHLAGNNRFGFHHITGGEQPGIVLL